MIKYLSLKYLELPPESFDDHVNSLCSNLDTFTAFLVRNHADTCDKLTFSIQAVESFSFYRKFYPGLLKLITFHRTRIKPHERIQEYFKGNTIKGRNNIIWKCSIIWNFWLSSPQLCQTSHVRAVGKGTTFHVAPQSMGESAQQFF